MPGLVSPVRISSGCLPVPFDRSKRDARALVRIVVPIERGTKTRRDDVQGRVAAPRLVYQLGTNYHLKGRCGPGLAMRLL